MTTTISSPAIAGCRARSKAWTGRRNGRRCALAAGPARADACSISAAASAGSAAGRASRARPLSSASTSPRRCWLARAAATADAAIRLHAGPTWSASSCRRRRSTSSTARLALHYVDNLDWLLSVVHSVACARRQPGVLGRASDFYRAFRARLVRQCRRPQDLAGRRLSGRGPAHDGLAGQGRHQAAPDSGDLHQHAAPRRASRSAMSRNGDRRNEQIATNPGWADERQRPPFLLVAARR